MKVEYGNIAVEIGASHLSNNKNYEVQRTNHWEIQITGIPGDGTDEMVTLLTSSAAMPQFSVETVELTHVNGKSKVAGAPTLEAGDLTVLDAIDVDMEMRLYNWFCQVYNPKTNQMGWSSVYKKNAKLVLFGPDGSSKRVWKLEGVWPTTFNPGELNYDGSDKKMLTMTLSYDKAYREDNVLGFFSVEGLEYWKGD